MELKVQGILVPQLPQQKIQYPWVKLPNPNYTHIIVDAGSAGCVIAARLTENTTHSVLLIEAGPDYGGVSENKFPTAVRNSRKVPREGRSESFGSLINWSPKVTMPDGSLLEVPQAKIIGGGSSINGGTALRSVQNDSKE